MHGDQTRTEGSGSRSGGWNLGAMPCCAGGVEWSGACGDMRQMMKDGPCARWLERHRLAVCSVLAAAGLGLLILHVGWLLGVIAFFRTL